MDEGGADPGTVVLPALARAVRCRSGVQAALLATDEPVPATIGDIAELGDVDVDHRPRIGMLVTPQRLPGDAVDVGEPVDPAPTSTACTVEAGTPSRPAIWTGPSRFRQRNATMRRTTGCGVLLGLVRGRELRSAIPAEPSARYLSAHFLAVRSEEHTSELQSRGHLVCRLLL